MLYLLFVLLAPPPERWPAPVFTDPQAAQQAGLIQFGLGIWRDRLELPVQAIQHLEAAVRIDPNQPDALRELLKLYVDLGREAAATRTARRVLELDPNDVRTASELGQLLVRSKRFDEAGQVFKKAADVVDADVQAARKLGLLKDAARAAELAQDGPTAAQWTEDGLTLLRQHRDQLARDRAYADATGVQTAEAQWLQKYGDRLVQVQRYSEAAKAYESSAQLWAGPLKQPALAARLQWNLSGVLTGQKRYADALAATAKFVSLGPDGLEPYQRLADLLRRLDRGEEIVGMLTQLRSRFPNVEAISWIIAAETFAQNEAVGHREFQTLFQQNTAPELVAVMVQSYASQTPNSYLLGLLLQLELLARGPVDEDDERITKELTAAQRTAAAQFRQLTTAIRQNQKASLVVLDSALEQSLNVHPMTLGFLQEVAEEQGRSEQALELARRAFDLDPRKYFSNYYWLLFRAKRWQEAIAVCNRAEQGIGGRVNRRGTSRLYSYDRAIPLAELGRTAEALKAVDEVTRQIVGDGRIAARALRMRVLSVLGRYDEAIQVGLETFPLCNTPKELRELRLALYQPYNDTKQYAEAEKLLRDQLETDPDDALVLNNLGYNLADEGRKLEEAETMIRRALALERDERARRGERELISGSYLDSLGWVLFRRGKLKEAREVLEQAAKLNEVNHDGVIWDHLGDVAFRQQDTKRAREAWTKAAQLYRNSHVGREHGRRDEVLRKLEQTK